MILKVGNGKRQETAGKILPSTRILSVSDIPSEESKFRNTYETCFFF